MVTMRNYARQITILLLLALVAASPIGPARGEETRESGAFTLYKFQQPIGRESYEIAPEGASRLLTSTFEFTDRGTKVPLTASLRTAPDMTPERFEISGKTSRSSSIETKVEIANGRAKIAEGSATREVALPKSAFAIAGYAPVALQMAMLRYWLSHGKPKRLATVPAGEVTILDRGADTVKVGGKAHELRRYSVDGLLWGREALWLDAPGDLVGLVSIDAEYDHFEAVREGFEEALPFFISRAAEDGLAQLAEITAATLPKQAKTIAIVGGRLIDGRGGVPIPDATVVVSGERIVAAGARGEIEVPKGATILDARGKTILPGLWDMHAHFQQVEWGPVYLAAGVTTVRDCANELDFVVAARDAIASGKGIGPRLLLAGVVDSDSPMAIGIQRANTPEEARAIVARYKAAGFQQIKIYQSFKPELIPVISAEAHRNGMTLTGHVPNGITAEAAVDAGMDQINHTHAIAGALFSFEKLRSLPPAEAAKMIRAIDVDSEEARRLFAHLAEKKTVVDPTLALNEWLWRPASTPVSSVEPGAAKVAAALAGPLANTGAPPERVELMQALFDLYVRVVGALHRAGVRVVAGTDQAIPGHSLHREMEIYVRAGMTPMEAILAATSVPARVMGLEKEVGTIEAGKSADVVVVDGDPLEHIENARRVVWTIARGRLYEPAPLWRSVGFQP
jgi:imidazolonepropionase-like amidohydrolase